MKRLPQRTLHRLFLMALMLMGLLVLRFPAHANTLRAHFAVPPRLAGVASEMN